MMLSCLQTKKINETQRRLTILLMAGREDTPGGTLFDLLDHAIEPLISLREELDK